MSFIKATFLALFVLFIGYLGYGYIQLRQELNLVFETEDKYAYVPEAYDLTVVDFSKYACKKCREFHPILMEAIRRDGKVRYVPRIVTFGFIWHDNLAAGVYAAGEQGKFIELHDALYKDWPIDEYKDLFLRAKRFNLDLEKMKRDMVDPDLRARARQDQGYFESWRIEKTPTIMIGGDNRFTPGDKMPTVDDLLKMFEQARS